MWNLTGPKALAMILGTYMKFVTKYKISVINNCWEKCDEKWAYSSMCIKINKVGKQEVGIWRVQERFPRYGIPMWSLRPNIRFLPSMVAEKNATKNILEERMDRQTDRGKTVYPPPPSGSGDIIRSIHCSSARATKEKDRN